MKNRSVTIALVLLLASFGMAFLPAAAVAGPGLPKKVYEVNAGTQDGVQAIADAGFDIWQVKGTVVTVALADAELAVVQSKGMSARVLISDIDAYVRATEAVSATSAVQYHTYSTLVSDLRALESSGIAKVYTIGRSIEGRDIVAVKISDNPAVEEPGEKEILYVGCHHAREWISVEVPYYFAKHLIDNYSTDPQIKSYVDNGAIWIVPIVNPDGFEYTLTERLWRKNRRNNGGGVYGVDLNRNYDAGFGGPGSSGIPSSDTYHGTGPFSEPEAAAVRDLVLAHNFQALLTWHSYSQLVLWPIGYSNSKAPDDAHLGRLANEMAYRIKQVHAMFYTPEKSSSLYLASGTTDDWFYEHEGVPGFTIELRPTGASPGFLLPADQIVPTAEENIQPALYLLGLTQSDRDGDGVLDIMDNCPTVVNANQADADSDGIGDVCETGVDRDGDGIADGSDNCPDKANADQKDTDSDGYGDLCDPSSGGTGPCGGLPGPDARSGSAGATLFLLALPAIVAASKKRTGRR